jgi:hypothetical protein
MCHEYTANEWIWEPEHSEEPPAEDDELPEFLNEESDTAAELVTDGGDES